ncbi:ParA family protein [Singulisphaera rosea]
MIAITFFNQKGGVGKTSSVFHLSAALAKMGQRVLLLDNDPQASLTQGFIGPDRMLEIPREASVAALYDEDSDPSPESLLLPSGVPGITLIPGSIHLNHWNMVPLRDWATYQFGMGRFLDSISSDFDVVLVDSPPNIYLCSWSSLCASQYIVVPVQCEDFGSQGLAPVSAAIEAVQRGPNPALRLGGYLPTLFDKRLLIHQTYDADLRAAYGEDVFTNVFPFAKDFKESVSARMPIALYKPKSAPAKAIVAIAEELMARTGLATVAIETTKKKGAA